MHIIRCYLSLFNVDRSPVSASILVETETKIQRKNKMKNYYSSALALGETRSSLVTLHNDLLVYQTESVIPLSDVFTNSSKRVLDALDLNINILDDGITELKQQATELVSESTAQLITEIESKIVNLNDELDSLNDSLNIDTEIMAVEELKTSIENLINYYQGKIDLLTRTIFRFTENKSVASNGTILGLDELLASLKKNLANTKNKLTEINMLLAYLYKLQEFILHALKIVSNWSGIIAPLLPYGISGASSLGLSIVVGQIREYLTWFKD